LRGDVMILFAGCLSVITSVIICLWK
jgi:hypothetical protein